MSASHYDVNDNLVKEVINGKENTYKYNKYDELTESVKYIDGEKVKTTYGYDLMGNQVVNTSKDVITISYDSNGNIEEKKHSNGSVEKYEYNDLQQLTEVDQGQYVYNYFYDAEGERIKQTITDTKDYHYGVWYDYNIPVSVTSDEQIDSTFNELKEQIARKEDLGGVCSVSATDSYDVTYYKPVVERNYLLDRNEEYTQVLHDENGTNIYGLDLIQKNSTAIVNDYNGSVIVKTKDDKSTVFNYSDYGKSNSVKEGHAYNGEMQDLNGLIYLRARYYDPSISRFVQVDKNYDGEKEVVASQNKYIYTLNNPYKYVDRDGNIPKQGGGIGRTGGIGCVYPPNLIPNLNNSNAVKKIREQAEKELKKQQEEKEKQRKKDEKRRKEKELQDLIKKYAQEGRWDLVAALLASGMLPSWMRDVIKDLVQKPVNPTTTCPDDEVCMMTISNAYIELVKKAELIVDHDITLAYESYEGGFQTAGIGHKFKSQEEQDTWGTRINPNNHIPMTQIDTWFREDTQWAMDHVNVVMSEAGYQLTQSQFDGFVDVAFCAGPHSGGGAADRGKLHDLINNLKSGNTGAIQSLLISYHGSNVRRSNMEIDLILNNRYFVS